jgi:putative two-component system response regulator
MLIAESDIRQNGDLVNKASDSRHDGDCAVAPVVDQDSAKIMIVDDEPTNIKVVRRLLEIEGYRNFVTTTDSSAALYLIEDQRPSLVLLDLMMPMVSGLDILSRIRQNPARSFLPIIILTAATDRDTRLQALEQGATDFITKPVDPSDLIPRVRNVLAMMQYQRRLTDRAADLETAVRMRTAELEASREDVLHCLARAAEYRDHDTGQHVLRVGRYARIIAEELGMPPESVHALEQAARLHDVGKIGVPDDILLKAGELTDAEFSDMKKHSGFGKKILQQCSVEEQERMKRHTEVGAQILKVGSSPILEMATRVALTHHEWWDGNGYPLGLQGEDIPLEGRITAVADAFDALNSQRCYKDAFPLEKCFAIIEGESGTHFDPQIVSAFIRRRTDIIAVQIECADDF